MKTRPVFIAGSARTPFVKSFTHFKECTTPELMIRALQGLVDKLNLKGQIIGDVALGALINSSNNWNLSRECVLGTNLHPHTPGYTLQRACGTSLEATLQIALKISNYQIDNGIAGGVDTNSDLPVMLPKTFVTKLLNLKKAKTWKDKIKIIATFNPRDFKLSFPQVVEPRTQCSMGQHCEQMVQAWKITRAEQDSLSLQSHQNAVKAYQAGFFDDLIVDWLGVKQDGTVRSDTSLEQLSKLKPAFDYTGKGSLTAGNSSPLTDGAAAVFLTTDTFAKQSNLPLLARFVDARVAAVDFVQGEGLLMAPTKAVSALLKAHQYTLQDFDFYEIHEAFAGQVLCTLSAWESTEFCKKILNRDQAMGAIDRTKLNVTGSSIAIGHPFAATGARIVGTLAKLLHQKKSGRGLISICTAGGMGIAAILEGVVDGK